VAFTIEAHERIARWVIRAIAIHAISEVRVSVIVIIVVVGIGGERGCTEPERNGEPQSVMKVAVMMVTMPPPMPVPPILAVSLLNQLDLWRNFDPRAELSADRGRRGLAESQRSCTQEQG
jgi:hypothetical protein